MSELRLPDNPSYTEQALARIIHLLEEGALQAQAGQNLRKNAEIDPLVVTEPMLELASEPVQIDEFPAQISPYRELLAQFRADREIAELLNLTAENDADNLVRLIANAAQFATLDDIWELLANRCKRDKRVATEQESALLAQAVAVHNLIYRDRAVRLEGVDIGSGIDLSRMQKIGDGDIVKAVYLPALRNAAGEIVRNVLVGV